MNKVISLHTAKPKVCLKCVVGRNKSNCNDCKIYKQALCDMDNSRKWHDMIQEERMAYRG